MTYSIRRQRRFSLILFLGLLLASCDLGFVDGADELRAEYPTCSRDAIDPDGDGWGWEQGHSCIVVDDESGDGGGAATCAYVDGSCFANGGDCRVYDDYGERSGVKTEIWNQMYRINMAGRSGVGAEAEARCRADLAVAMAMQETHSFAVDWNGNLPYDATKDARTDGSQNVCVFNMNVDFIRRSCRGDCGPFQSFYDQRAKMYLNQRGSLPECVRRLNDGFDHFGIDGTLHFHRGGSSGWEHPGADERAFARAQKVVADYLRDHSLYRTNGSRVAHSIGHR